MEKNEEILTSMGYRLLKPGVWAKPVAYHLFMFEVDKKLWTNFFKGANEALCIWNSETYKEEDWVTDAGGEPDFLYFLKYSEYNTRSDTSNYSSFEFLTAKEVWELNL